MANLNRIILVGRLFADPDARSTVDGTPITKFKLAVNRVKREGKEQEADVVDIITWRRLAEVCAQYLRKGKMVLVEGKIQNRSYEDQNGQKRYVTEVVARNMQMLDKVGAVAATMPVASAQEEVNVSAVDEVLEAEEDLPF